MAHNHRMQGIADPYLNARKFPNQYTLNPERFLPDLASALGRNRPDSDTEDEEEVTHSQDTDEAPAQGMPRPKTGQY